MNVYYILSFTYPDGHVEELDERYETLDDAVEFGDNLFNQVMNTERFHRNENVDDFGRPNEVEPYFIVIKIEDKSRKIVFSSRG